MRLLEKLHKTLTARELTTRCSIKIRSKHREGCHRTVLSKRELQGTGDLLHRLNLSSTTDTRHRNTDINSRSLVRVEEVRLKEDLAIGNRNNVGRNVGRNVICLGFDNRQTGHRSPTELVGELRTAFQQARVQVENVTGVRFTPRRTAQKKRNCAVGLGLLRKVIENDKDVLTLVHPVLTNCATRVGSHVLVAGGIRGRRSNDRRVLHCSGLLKSRANRSDRRPLLTDGDIDASNLLVNVAGKPVVTLVNDRVQSDCGLTGLTVTNDELTLTTTDRNHRVDRFQAGLQRLVNRFTHHDTGSLEFQCSSTFQVGDITEAVDGAAQRVNGTTEVAITNGH